MAEWLPPRAPEPALVSPPAADNGAARIAFGLGLGALGALVLTVGVLFLVTLPCSVLAWVHGVRGRRRADGREAGRRAQAVAGLRLGIAGTLLALLAGAVWILLLTGGIEVTPPQEDFDRGPLVLRAAGTLAATVLR